jgi:hypothetical protein
VEDESDINRPHEQKHILHNRGNCRYRNRAQIAGAVLAARLVGKSRETMMKAAAGLDSKPGPKNAKLYNANALMMSIYCGNQRALYWQADQKFWRGEF